MGTGLLAGCGVGAGHPVATQSASPSSSQVNQTSQGTPGLSISHSKQPPPLFNFFSFWPQKTGITLDVASISPTPAHAFTPSELKKGHLWDRGYRFTFILRRTHAVLAPNPPLEPGMTKIVLNRNIPLHGRWVSAVRLHPVGTSLEVTCSLSRPARHYSVGISRDLFTISFS